MAIDPQVMLSAAPASLAGYPAPLRKTGSGLFGELLASQMTQNLTSSGITRSGNTDETENYIEELKKKGCIGFFENLEKDKLEKLREEILGEMKLTEEELSKFPPAQRAAIEQKIAEEIQRRMAMGSMDQDNKDKNFPAVQTGPDMGEFLVSFSAVDILEQPVSLTMTPLSKPGQTEQET